MKTLSFAALGGMIAGIAWLVARGEVFADTVAGVLVVPFVF